jgi:hypothetical protein
MTGRVPVKVDFFCGASKTGQRGSSTNDEPLKPTDRNPMPTDQIILTQIAKYEALAEQAYEEMYDSRYPVGCYANLKDYFSAAIGAANQAGLTDQAKRLEKRLDHCKEVYRKQFSNC